MIEERYCSFEIAKLLREKGFTYDGRLWYDKYGIITYVNTFLLDASPYVTHQMACDWLMTKGIYICPKYCCFQGSKKNDKPYFKWEPTILSLSSSFPLYPQPLDRCEHFDTFGEAVDFSIKYSLENLI